MWKLLLVLSFVFIAASADAEPAKEEGVVVLTDVNFKAYVKAQDLLLVEFYAPWCGHCKRLAPEWAKAAQELANANPPVPVAKLDCTAQKQTCESLGVHGYPSLKVFRKGESKDYKGPRVADGIVKFMLGMVGPSSTEVTSVEEAERFVPDPSGAGVMKVIVFGFFKNKEQDFDRFMDLAEEWRSKLTFVHTHTEEVLRRYGYRHTFVIFRPFDTPRVAWPETEGLGRTPIRQFTSLHGLPAAGELTEENDELYRARGLVDVTLFTVVDFKTNDKKMQYYLTRLRKLAAAHTNISFKIADKTKFKHIFDRFAFTLDEVDADRAIGMYDSSRDSRWRYTAAKFDVNSVKDFIRAVHEGTVPKFIKSEANPKESHSAGDGKVAVLTANNFNMIVKDATKDALVEMYAPWCGHCKKLTPIYDALAAEYKGVTDIVIAKMDATANDAPAGYTASGFPTIYYAPKGNKESPEKFAGDRTVEGFKKFLSEKRKK